MQTILDSLQERAKELNCLYQVDETLNRSDVRMDDVFRELVRSLPHGWQYPDICEARLTINREVYKSSEFRETPWVMAAEIVSQGEPVGAIAVYYMEERPDADEGPFLKQERRLALLLEPSVGALGHEQVRRVVRRHTRWPARVSLAGARPEPPVTRSDGGRVRESVQLAAQRRHGFARQSGRRLFWHRSAASAVFVE